MSLQSDPSVTALAYPAFRWNEIPLRETASALGNLAIALLAQVLDPSKVPSPQLFLPFDWRSRSVRAVFPGIDQFVHARPARRHKRKGARLIFLRDRLAHWRVNRIAAPKENDLQLTTYWRPLVNHALRGDLSDGARGRLMTLLLARRYYGADTWLLPRYLWKTASHLAFVQPAFQLQVARQLRSFLNHRILLPPPEFPAIEISANTFWLLIALYQPPRQRWFSYLRPSCYRHRRLARQLAQIARNQARTTGWAGFWDQWILLHFLYQQRDLVPRLNPLLRGALLHLPILEGTRLRAMSELKDTSQLELAHPSWQRPAPSWLRQLYPSDLWEVSRV